MRVVLGIDPGSRITGFGIIAEQAGRLRYVASGCLRLPQSELPERLLRIFQGIGDLVAEYRPHEFAIEQVFMARNADSALKLGQARGAAIVAAAHAGLPVSEYSARQVKQAVVGFGNAEKTQVQQMVVRLLGLQGVPSADAADALAIAICHLHSASLNSLLTDSRPS